jgi:hypothetical protein
VIDELVGARRTHQVKRPRSAQTLFVYMLGYRRDAERLIHASDGWLECSDPALRGLITAEVRIGERIRELMVDVDRWLRTLIDPSGMTLERRELIARYRWPDVDVRDLELDEL